MDVIQWCHTIQGVIILHLWLEIVQAWSFEIPPLITPWNVLHYRSNNFVPLIKKQFQSTVVKPNSYNRHKQHTKPIKTWSKCTHIWRMASAYKQISIIGFGSVPVMGCYTIVTFILWYYFTPVTSCVFALIYIIHVPQQNLIIVRVIPVWVHPNSCCRLRFPFWYKDSYLYHINLIWLFVNILPVLFVCLFFFKFRIKLLPS